MNRGRIREYQHKILGVATSVYCQGCAILSTVKARVCFSTAPSTIWPLPSTLAQYLTKQTGSLQSMSQTEFFGQYPSSQAFWSPQCRDSFTHGFKLGYVHSSKLKLVLHIPVICKYFLTPGMLSGSLLLGRFHHSALWSNFTVCYYSQKNTHMNWTIYQIIAYK